LQDGLLFGFSVHIEIEFR